MTRDVTLSPFAIRLKTPLQTAAGDIEGRRGFLLDVDGAFGEATPLPGWTESYAECERSLESATTLLADGTSWEEALAVCSTAPAARHAVDLARLDSAATRAGVPLAHLLSNGDGFARSVPVNETIGDSPARETAAHARRAVTNGFGCIKIKVGDRSVSDDVERLRAVRTEVGTDVELRADANGAWTPGQAQDAMEAFEDLDVTYVEQPLPADDLTELAALRRATDIGVALDESLATNGLEDVLVVGAADVVVLKPMALGGIVRTHTLATRARDFDVTPIVTTTIDAVVARSAALHVAASLGGTDACGLATARRLSSDLAVDPAPVRDGAMTVPAAPGIGVENPRTSEEPSPDD